MKTFFRYWAIALALCTSLTAWADDADLLQGKWSVKKVNEQGQKYTQIIEIMKDKFMFQIIGSDDQVYLVAEGDLKLEKLGPFDSARFIHIRAGDSTNNLQEIDDEYTCIYVLDGDEWTVAVNFDKQRGQKPSADVYQRVKAAARTLVIDEIMMTDTPQSGFWYLCFEPSVEGATRRYHAENKAYEKNPVTIPLALEIPKVKPNQQCTFKLQLDDTDADVCTDQADNRTTASFVVSERGSQSYKPQDNWRFTIRWHLK